MRIPQSYIQKCKVVGHVFQTIFIFVGLCITIAVFTKDGETGGATRYYLALVRAAAVASNKRSNGLTGVVLPLDTCDNLPHHGPHVVPRPTLRQRVRLSCRRCRLYDTMVRRLCRCRNVEQQRHQARRRGEEDSGRPAELHDFQMGQREQVQCQQSECWRGSHSFVRQWTTMARTCTDNRVAVSSLA
jgi:hypothetical protein